MTPTETSNGPSGREWGEMVNEVSHLKKATTEINLKLDDLPSDIVERINQARSDCRHIKTSSDHEQRLRSHAERISDISGEVKGIKRATAAITTAISLAIGAIGLALKWHK